VVQAQFAGYLVAKDKGFYKEAGLDVTIKPGGPDIAPPQVIAGGGADVVVEWMPAALAAREKGVALVNIAQPFKRSGMMLTCRAETGIKTPADLKGRTLGVWFFGNEYPFMSWMAKLGNKTDGSAGGVKVLKQGFNVDPLLQKQADCISTMTYNEYWQVIDGGIPADKLVVAGRLEWLTAGRSSLKKMGLSVAIRPPRPARTAATPGAQEPSAGSARMAEQLTTESAGPSAGSA